MPGKQIVEFDYGSLPTENRRSVQAQSQAIRLLLQRTSANVIEIGIRVREVKELVGPRHFKAWVRAEFEWSYETALHFIYAADRFDGCDVGKFQSSAMTLLARPYVPEEAVSEAKQRAESGELVTYSVANEIVRKHRPQKPSPSDRTALLRLKMHIDRLADQFGRRFIAEHLLSLAAELQQPEPAPPAESRTKGRVAAQA